MGFKRRLKAIKSKRWQLFYGFMGLLLALSIKGLPSPMVNYFLNQLEYQLYDVLVSMNPKPLPEFPKVAVIDIDEYSIEQLGRWPWSRSLFAQLLSRLKENGVVVVAFDIVFSKPEVNYALGLKQEVLNLKSDQWGNLISSLDKVAPLVDNDQGFANALKENDVVLGFLLQNNPNIRIGLLPNPLQGLDSQPIDASKLSTIHFKGYNSALPQFMEAAGHGGFVSNIPDQDGVVRHSLLVAGEEGRLYPSLALSTVLSYMLIDQVGLDTVQSRKNQLILKAINFGGIHIPTNSKGQILIPFYGPPWSMPYFSAADVIDNKIEKGALDGAIVIIGSSTILLSDIHPSPVSRTFSGVEMNANIIKGLLTQQITYMYHANVNLELKEMALLGLVLTCIFPFIGPIVLVIFYFIISFSILALGYALFIYENSYMMMVGFFLTLNIETLIKFLYDFIYERKQKNKIRQLFGQYVPPTHITQMTESAELYNMEGETREMSIFFSDVRGFTHLSEPLDAIQVKRLLNTLFTPMTKIIFEHKGTIDKYVGDMVVAFWGAPISDPNHAYNAVAAALTIKKELGSINAQLERLGLPSVQIGMGIATGLMNVGDMGSEFRRAYTVLGDTVNLGSRLESLTKFYHASILVSEVTRRDLEEFTWQFIDKVVVKGRNQSLSIYEPLCLASETNPELREELKEYELGLHFYYEQNWKEAKKIFQKLASVYPNRPLYLLYQERIKLLSKQTLAKDWDGVFVHTQK